MTEGANLSAIESLEPAPVWRFFAGISATPRSSKHEARIREHIRAVAEQHRLPAREDGAGNMVIDVPASPGCESAPITVLQGHLDMVGESSAGTQHDFERDPIRLVVEEESDSGKLIVRADGTTLGADNGMGMSLALAAATSPDVIHGPLELLFTVDEEAGMSGAKALTPDSFKGRRLLNLDSEEDDALCIGCAGGCDANLTWDFKTEPTPPGNEVARVSVSGLRGGHSGSDIHEGRGNAIKLLVRTLLDAKCDTLRIASVSGGSKRNAIPREAFAVVSGPPAMLSALEAAAKRVREEGVRESAEDDLSINVEAAAADDAAHVLAPEDTRRLLTVLLDLPHGVLGMHPTVADLVETSNNVATINSEMADRGRVMRVRMGALSRSSSSRRMEETLAQITALGQDAGAVVETGNDYPGWEPNLDSPILATCRRLYKELFDADPKVMAIHAGLECGIIGERVGNMDMVSLGPRILGGHTPEERVYVATVPKTWKYLKAILADLARG
jgi:dipeptidase D